MSSFEEKIEQACKDLEIPGVVLVGGSADGMDFSSRIRTVDRI